MIGGALLALATLPAAQTRDQDEEMRATSAREAARTMQLFADCTVSRRSNAEKVDAVLRAPTESEAAHRAGMALADGGCMPRSLQKTEMRMHPRLMRAALFEAQYRARYAKAGTDFAGVPPLDVASEFDGPVAPQDAYTRPIGDCVARQAGAPVQRLLLTRSGGDAEKAAFAEIVPVLTACVPENNTLRFSRAMLRGILGEAMVKLSAAAAAAPRNAS